MPQPVRIALALVAGFLALNLVSALLSSIAAALTHPDPRHLDQHYLIANLVAGLLAAAAGGSVAALVGTGVEMMSGLALAIVLLGFGAFSFRHSSASVPLWYAFTLAFVAPLVVFAAASITAKTTARRFL